MEYQIIEDERFVGEGMAFTLNHYIVVIVSDKNTKSGYKVSSQRKVSGETIKNLDNGCKESRKQMQELLSTVGVALAYEIGTMMNTTITEKNVPRAILLCTDQDSLSLDTIKELVANTLTFEDICTTTIINGINIVNKDESESIPGPSKFNYLKI